MTRKNGATRLLALLSAAVLLGSIVPAGTAIGARASTRSCPYTRTHPTHSNLRLISTAIVCLTDRERARRGLPALQPNRALQGVASSQTKDMVIGHYFGDLDLTGQTPWQRIATSPYVAGSHGVLVAQNIGWGNGAFATPGAMMSAWMRSPPHRRIVLTAGYRDIGVGVTPIAPQSHTHGPPGATYAVELAARR